MASKLFTFTFTFTAIQRLPADTLQWTQVGPANNSCAWAILSGRCLCCRKCCQLVLLKLHISDTVSLIHRSASTGLLLVFRTFIPPPMQPFNVQIYQNGAEMSTLLRLFYRLCRRLSCQHILKRSSSPQPTRRPPTLQHLSLPWPPMTGATNQARCNWWPLC